MAQLIAYFTFNGNCREAMLFYQECLGGKLYMQTAGETPLGRRLPRRMKNCIVHAHLQKEDLQLMATDMVEDQGLTRGNAVSVMVECNDENEINSYYEKLSAGGRSTHPVEKTFWGSLFGMLTDKYGNHWLLNCTPKEETNFSEE